MELKVRINGRIYTLSWSEFERLNTPHCIDILSINEKGGAYAAA